jgi:hypothetical protein
MIELIAGTAVLAGRSCERTCAARKLPGMRFSIAAPDSAKASSTWRVPAALLTVVRRQMFPAAVAGQQRSRSKSRINRHVSVLSRHLIVNMHQRERLPGREDRIDVKDHCARGTDPSVLRIV